MIKLDEKYGGIISSTRQFMFEEIAQSINFKVKLYIFNDLIVVVRMIDEEKEDYYKKIFLDEESYVEAPMDGKYFMSGSKVGLKSRYQVDGNELDLLKDLSKVRRGAPHYGRGLR